MVTKEQLESIDGTDTLAVSAYEGGILNRIVAEYQPKRLLEVGTGNSYSTAWMALALPDDGRIYTIDAERRKRFEGLKVDYLMGSLGDHIENLPKPIDLAFLDSDHTIDKIVKDIEMIHSHLSAKAVVVVHDTIYCEEMGYCLRDYFEGTDSSRLKRVDVKPATSRWAYTPLKTRYGLGIAVKKESN